LESSTSLTYWRKKGREKRREKERGTPTLSLVNRRGRGCEKGSITLEGKGEER